MSGKEKAAGVTLLFPDDLQEYVAKHGEGTYQLVDVRQPEEYEENHLPGSRLLPLPLLATSISELNRENDTIVYCAMGGRSLMAAKFLAARGFRSVFQLQGGIEAWEDRTATGPAGLHLEFVRGDETAEEAARIACRFESGLEQFHRVAFQRSENPEVRELLDKLIKAEESHLRKLEELLETLGSTPYVPARAGERMEGGLQIEDFLAENEKYLQSAQGCLELAMMIEVQALDLYLRMAQTCSDAAAGQVFFHLSDEEKGHLSSLGELMGKQAGA
ncbi:MAG: rhodanese-like domain-containing protein [Syntrophobacteraceae bacterium]